MLASLLVSFLRCTVINHNRILIIPLKDLQYETQTSTFLVILYLKAVSLFAVENLYFPHLGMVCDSDSDCLTDVLFSHCANGTCVCDSGYIHSSTVIQGLRQQLCLKNHSK